MDYLQSQSSQNSEEEVVKGAVESALAGEMDEDKKNKKPKRKESGASVAVKRDKILLDMTKFPQGMDKFLKILEKINGKAVGRAIPAEEIFAALIEKIDDNFVFQMQKNSMSSEEIDEIIRQRLNNSEDNDSEATFQ